MMEIKKRNIIVMFILLTLILVTTTISFIKTNKNSKENEIIISKCFEGFDELETKEVTVHFENNKARCQNG